MKHPSRWNKADLHHHLQHALAIELWTIPLYLTALYSIKDLKKSKYHDYPEAAKLLFSVVIQEMLHLELVCNISNALGFSPEFSPPVYDQRKGIPFIHPSKDCLPEALHGYLVKPQALNKNCLKLFCAIELPHDKNTFSFEGGSAYCSIGEFYEGLKIGVSSMWNECYVGDENNNKQKNTFREYHNQGGKNHGFSQVVNSGETAQTAIEAIICQGEGADSNKVPVDFRPHEFEEGKEYDITWYKGEMSHYDKFRVLLHSHHRLPPVYAENPKEESVLKQKAMEKKFMSLLREMETGFNTPGESLQSSFWQKMNFFDEAIVAVWESGACPQFDF